MSHVAVQFLLQLGKPCPGRMVDLHRRHIADAVTTRGCPLPPVTVLADTDPGKGADIQHDNATHDQVAGASKAFTDDIAVHSVGLDAFMPPPLGSVAQISLRSSFPFFRTDLSHAPRGGCSERGEAVRDRRTDLPLCNLAVDGA